MIEPDGAADTGPADPRQAGLIEELIDLGRRLVGAGLVLGSGGNLSARPPGAGTAVLTARGSWLDRLVPADFSLVRLSDGAVLGGTPAPSTELALHPPEYARWLDTGAGDH